MPSDTTGPGDITTIEESVGEFQERKYLEQVYDSYRSARQAVSEWEASQGGDPGARRIAIVALSDIIRLVEPLLQESKYWEETLGHVEMVKNGEVRNEAIAGLDGFLNYRDGVPTVVEEETPGRGRNTKLVETVAPLPGRIITAALRALTQFLHEEGVLALESGENKIDPSAF